MALWRFENLEVKCHRFQIPIALFNDYFRMLRVEYNQEDLAAVAQYISEGGL